MPRGLLINTGPNRSGVGNYVKLILEHSRVDFDLLNTVPFPLLSPEGFPVSPTGLTRTMTSQRGWLVSGLELLGSTHARVSVDQAREMRSEYDLILIASQDNAHLIPSLRNAFNCPVFITVHDTGAFRLGSLNPLRHFVSWNLGFVHHADGIFVDHGKVRNELVARGYAHADKVSELGIAVDPLRFRIRASEEARARLKIPLDTRVVLTIGRDWFTKNLRTVLRAFSANLHKDAILVRVGRWDLSRQQYEQLPPAIRKRIILRESVDDEDLPWYYDAADVFVFPSISEGFGIELVEAIFSGTPVVTTQSEPMLSIASGCALFLKSATDDAELTRLVRTILNDPRIRTIQRQSGMSVRERYSVVAFSERLDYALSKTQTRSNLDISLPCSPR